MGITMRLFTDPAPNAKPLEERITEPTPTYDPDQTGLPLAIVIGISVGYTLLEEACKGIYRAGAYLVDSIGARDPEYTSKQKNSTQ